MKQQDRNPKQIHPCATRLGALAAALLCLGLLTAAPASASYEQVGTFAGTPGVLHNFSPQEEWPEKVQLGGVGGMAVNVTGAGGVPPGTLYAYTVSSTGTGGVERVARFNPDGSFSENWTFEGSPPKERCGPNGEPAHPVCKSRPNGFTSRGDVDVDPSTGYVYVLDNNITTPGVDLVHVYSADGSELIAEFGVSAAAGETTAASPEKIHNSPYVGGIAVDASGKVYVFDTNTVFGETVSVYHRLMVFEPQFSGDYEHYVYAGQSHDIAAGFATETILASRPVADAAGDIYVLGGIFDLIAKLDPSQPSAAPICEFSFPKGHIHSITVNPQNGEVFFYTDTDKKIHRLSACKEGKFTEAGSFGFSPPRFELSALAFNPTGQFGPGRPAGTLYAGALSGEGGKTEAGELHESSMGYIFAPPAEFPPEVKSESVEHVTATTAHLSAQINPKGPPTDYVFQYITQAQYEANEPADRFAGAAESPLGGALLGEGPSVLSAATSLTGLSPDTTYHYRAIVTSHCSVEDEEKLCEGMGVDQVFRTFPIEAPGLPDKRAYELVSPAQKQGGQVFPADPGISNCGVESSCKPGLGRTRFPLQSRPDGEAIVYEGTSFSSGEGSAIVGQYISRRDPKAGWQTVNLTPTLLNDRDPGYMAFDSALSQGLLAQSTPALNPQAPPEYQDLYTQPTANPLAFGPLLTAEPPSRLPGELKLIYAGASTDLSRIFFAANDALTGETAFAPEALDGGVKKNNLYEWAEGQLRLVNVLPGNAETQPGASFGTAGVNAISADGSRVFFTDEASQLYVRENGETTKAIPGPGKVLSDSVDGSKVLLDDGCLYDHAQEECEDLTVDGGDVHQGGFLGIAGQSEDLSHVYFVDSKVLTGEEANSEGDKAQAGKDNLYAWKQGSATSFVATLVAPDNNGNNLSRSRTWSSLPSKRTAEASPDGRFLSFQSQAQITGYDNTGPCESDHEGGFVQNPCTQVFLYDSATNELRCASCNPSGIRPLGLSVLRLLESGSKVLPQSRYLTDSGRLYFDSHDSLTPFDTNNGFEDVYQYEPDGVGSCERAGGCVSLISAGSEPNDSNFLAMDEDGRNVFFTTRDQLVLKDHDDLIDLYDAREDGGIPAETEAEPIPCQGEACVPALSPPNDLTPGSSSFEGGGNVDEKHKKKHAKKHKSHKRSHGRAAKHNRGGAK